MSASVAEEIEQSFGLAAARAEVHVGDEKRAITLRSFFRHDSLIILLLIMERRLI